MNTMKKIQNTCICNKEWKREKKS